MTIVVVSALVSVLRCRFCCCHYFLVQFLSLLFVFSFFLFLFAQCSYSLIDCTHQKYPFWSIFFVLNGHIETNINTDLYRDICTMYIVYCTHSRTSICRYRVTYLSMYSKRNSFGFIFLSRSFSQCTGLSQSRVVTQAAATMRILNINTANDFWVIVCAHVFACVYVYAMCICAFFHLCCSCVFVIQFYCLVLFRLNSFRSVSIRSVFKCTKKKRKTK